jgi:hypothetical protein
MAAVGPAARRRRCRGRPGTSGNLGPDRSPVHLRALGFPTRGEPALRHPQALTARLWSGSVAWMQQARGPGRQCRHIVRPAVRAPIVDRTLHHKVQLLAVAPGRGCETNSAGSSIACSPRASVAPRFPPPPGFLERSNPIDCSHHWTAAAGDQEFLTLDAGRSPVYSPDVARRLVLRLPLHMGAVVRERICSEVLVLRWPPAPLVLSAIAPAPFEPSRAN